MMNIKHVVAAAALGTATMAPTVASADLSGNAGVMSQYLFRGLEQGPAAAAYGGIDYAHDSGFYAGTWAATIGFASASGTSSELDLYAGFSGGDAVTYDVGAIYYYYSEEDEAGSANPSNNTFELYGSVGTGPFSLSAYYAIGDYFAATNVDNPSEAADGAYGIYGSASFPLTDILALDASIGYNAGEGNEFFAQSAGDTSADSYMEYNLGVSAGLDNGFGFGFGLVMTDIEGPGQDDDPKLVVDASYSFDLM